MKKIYFFLAVFAAMFLVISCSDEESYADQEKKERKAVAAFIKKKNIKVISEQDFEAAGEVTDTAKNEYVLFDDNGVYMQIVRKGVGSKLQLGSITRVICRYYEINLFTDSIQARNNSNYFNSQPDIMTVRNNKGNLEASFETTATMYYFYRSASVPTGWLVPLNYVNIGRPENEDDQIAKVRLIVPHAAGQAYASAQVYPCFYEITYQKAR